MAQTQKTTDCPECGGVAVWETRPDTVEYKGHKATVELEGFWCQECPEAVFEGPALMKREKVFLNLRAEVDGTLGPKQVAAIREHLGLSQRKAGEVIGGGPRAFQKYESGEQQVSSSMAQLLKLLNNDPGRLKELKEPLKLHQLDKGELMREVRKGFREVRKGFQALNDDAPRTKARAAKAAGSRRSKEHIR